LQAREWKFTKFRTKPRQLRLFEQLLNSDWVSSDAVKIYAIHKRFMALTKIVDLIHEPSAREAGINLYERGGALATANLLTTVLPTYLGDDLDAFINAFIVLVRRRDLPSLRHFYQLSCRAYEKIENNFPETIGWLFIPVIVACEKPDSWLPFLHGSELDPLIPAYYTLVDEWGKTLRARFEVIADESNTLSQERDRLMKFASQDLRNIQVGSPARNFKYPLKVSSIEMVRSADTREVQIADLFAGAACYALKHIASPRAHEPSHFEKSFFDLMQRRQLICGIWPSKDVTPEELGTMDFVGENPVDYAVRIMKGDPSTRS
jgi:hypothetical protein